MKKSKIASCLVFILIIATLSSCSNLVASPATRTILEMELTENYDTYDPFIHAKLFCVSNNIEALDLEISFQMEGKAVF